MFMLSVEFVFIETVFNIIPVKTFVNTFVELKFNEIGYWLF